MNTASGIIRIIWFPGQCRRLVSVIDFCGFIEMNLHGCFHEMAARLLKQPELNEFDLAPRHTEFYNIHGLIDQWYINWERVWGIRGQENKSCCTR